MDNHRIYAIGDIHGYRRALDKMLGLIECDADGCDYRLVFIGDYVDRGPESRGVLDRAIELRDGGWRYPPVFLMGNHEEKMLAALELDLGTYDNFMQYGGDTTMASYGVDVTDYADPMEALRAFKAAVGEAHYQFLKGLSLSFQTKTHFFCHAGVDFSKGLDAQDSHDLVWMREPFLSSPDRAEKIIVHGHTFMADYMPQIMHNRIGIDTGIFESGKLTACVLDGDAPPRFLNAQI